MRLSWNRNEDATITIYATENGKIAEIADVWQRPMREDLGVSRPRAAALQQQFAEWLCDKWNAEQLNKPRDSDGCWLNLPNCKGNCGDYGCGG